ncbi:transposase, partial [Chloroflexota bacterium]
MTEFTVAEVQEMTHDQLVDLITRRGRGRFHDPAATARAVRKTLRTSYPIDPQMDEMITAALAAGWNHIRYLKRSMKHLDRLIARYIDLVPNPIITIKGLGAVITAGILAEIVDVLRFPEEKHLAQFMGLTWRQRSSGRFVSQNRGRRKSGLMGELEPQWRYFAVFWDRS